MEGNNQETDIVKNSRAQIADQPPKQEKSKIGWALCAAGIIALVAAILIVILSAVCTYSSFVSTSGNDVPSTLGINIFSIQTDSMCDTLMPGDLIIGTSVRDASDLRKGDIVTYWTIINGERVLNTHRIYEIYDGGGYLIFATKGDANTTADPLTVHESDIVAKYAFRIGGLGKVFDYLQTSTGFLLFVLIMAFMFLLLLILGIVLMAIGLFFIIRKRRNNRQPFTN